MGHLQAEPNVTGVYHQKGTNNSLANSASDTLITHIHASIQHPKQRRANATFVVLARNNDLEGVVEAVRQMEDRFNKKYKYPWVLLNEEPFTNNFKRSACSSSGLDVERLFNLLTDVLVS